MSNHDLIINFEGSLPVILLLSTLATLAHTGLEALPSQKKVSVHGTGVPVFLRPVW